MNFVTDSLPAHVVVAGSIWKRNDTVERGGSPYISWTIHKCKDKLLKDDSTSWIWSPPFSHLGCTWEFHLDAVNVRKGGNLRIKICRKMPPLVTARKTVKCTVRTYDMFRDYSKTATLDGTACDLMVVLDCQQKLWRDLDEIRCYMREVEVPPISSVVPQSSKPTLDGLGTNPPGLVRDLERLLASGDVSDVTIRTEGENIRAHRAILAARSDVFRAMFVHDTSESASGVVDIGDCEPDTFRKFLAYLYAGRLEKHSYEDAIGLYVIADKYQVEELSQECLELIRGSLSLETFCCAVTLMVKHGQREGMTRLAADFLRANVAEIIRTVDWETFLCEHPKEVNELLREALGSDKK